MFVLKLTREGNRKMSRIIDSLLHTHDTSNASINQLQEEICASTKTKSITYREINPNLSVHTVYSKHNIDNLFIPEHYRIAFSQMRLSSHRLRIETGRWSRIPQENRVCECGAVQNESHILTVCPLTQHLRNTLDRPVVYPDILHLPDDVRDFKYIHDVLKVYS